jgi:hypothetical protein
MDETVEVICRREEHYACGCSTTHIETVQGALGLAAHCAGHGEPMIKTITTNELQSSLGAGARPPVHQPPTET